MTITQFAKEHQLKCGYDRSLPGGPIIPGKNGIIVEHRGRLVAGPHSYPKARKAVDKLKATGGRVRDHWPGFAYTFDPKQPAQVSAAFRLIKPRVRDIDENDAIHSQNGQESACTAV